MSDENEAFECAELEALALVFDDVRKQSAASVLVEPSRWDRLGLVPDHLNAEEFEMLVYEWLESEQQKLVSKQAPIAAVEPVRSASTAVGVPPSIAEVMAARRAAECLLEEEEEEVNADVVCAQSDDADDEPDDDECDEEANACTGFDDLTLPEGYELTQLEGEWVLVPTDKAPEPKEVEVDGRNIAVLVGAHSYYLYDESLMTSTFAHWAFLSEEDDPLITFVECAREESRVYPRPMPAQSLVNAPFRMTPSQVRNTWRLVSESGEYPDIKRVVASNGDEYYFSTAYLKPALAQSLAEWDAVERLNNV